jgi:hypothetical protein
MGVAWRLPCGQKRGKTAPYAKRPNDVQLTGGQFKKRSYRIRANLEAEVHSEKENVQPMIDAGQTSLAILAQIVDANVSAAIPERIQAGNYFSKSGERYTVTLDANQLPRLSLAEPDNVAIISGEIVALPGLVFAQMVMATTTQYGVVVPKSPDRFTLYWFDSKSAPKQCDFERAS